MQKQLIHPSAIIEPGAKIGNGVSIGPFSYIGAEVELHDRVQIKSHVVVTGKTEIGRETIIYPFSVIGEVPQDLKFNGEKTSLIIGKRNKIREHVTINTGTEGGGGLTLIGNDCLFMTGSHVAHDVQISNGVIIANCGAVAGHCTIEDDVIIGGDGSDILRGDSIDSNDAAYAAWQAGIAEFNAANPDNAVTFDENMLSIDNSGTNAGDGNDVIVGGDGLDDIKSGDGQNFVTSGKADIDGDGQANLDLINQNIENHQHLLDDEDWV